jgi:hypothetical protein
MDREWFRAHRLSLVAAALAALAVAAQIAEVVAVVNVPPPDPRIAITLLPRDEKVLAIGMWVAQGALATLALGFGIAATIRRRGRVLGIIATAIALGVLAL